MNGPVFTRKISLLHLKKVNVVTLISCWIVCPLYTSPELQLYFHSVSIVVLASGRIYNLGFQHVVLRERVCGSALALMARGVTFKIIMAFPFPPPAGTNVWTTRPHQKERQPPNSLIKDAVFNLSAYALKKFILHFPLTRRRFSFFFWHVVIIIVLCHSAVVRL